MNKGGIASTPWTYLSYKTSSSNTELIDDDIDPACVSNIKPGYNKF
jgi:hypothetical protein